MFSPIFEWTVLVDRFLVTYFGRGSLHSTTYLRRGWTDSQSPSPAAQPPCTPALSSPCTKNDQNYLGQLFTVHSTCHCKESKNKKLQYYILVTLWNFYQCDVVLVFTIFLKNETPPTHLTHPRISWRTIHMVKTRTTQLNLSITRLWFVS